MLLLCWIKNWLFLRNNEFVDFSLLLRSSCHHWHAGRLFGVSCLRKFLKSKHICTHSAGSLRRRSGCPWPPRCCCARWTPGCRGSSQPGPRSPRSGPPRPWSRAGSSQSSGRGAGACGRGGPGCTEPHSTWARDAFSFWISKLATLISEISSHCWCFNRCWIA